MCVEGLSASCLPAAASLAGAAAGRRYARPRMDQPTMRCMHLRSKLPSKAHPRAAQPASDTRAPKRSKHSRAVRRDR